MRETIYALASAAGRAGIAVFRISGVLAGPLLEALSQKPLPPPRQATLRRLVDQRDKTPLDEALVLWFPAPASFTGEDVVEFHAHGGPAIIEALAQACQALGARQATPGEFTRRAYENGKLDLVQAEGLADLIEAETQAQRRQALRQMEGDLSTVYQGWREKLQDCLVYIESSIDFPDEEDIPQNLHDKAKPVLQAVLEQMKHHLDDGARGRSLRDGVRIALIGAPNAGKSTLLNALARRDAAIVSTTPGTTRDIVEVRLVIKDMPIWIADTAGLRDSEEAIEAEGVRRALQRAKDSDMRLGVVDGAEPDELDSLAGHLHKGDFLLLNKSDQAFPDRTHERMQALGGGWQCMRISALTGKNMEAFEKALGTVLQERFSVTEQAGLTRLRHARAVGRAMEALERAMAVVMHAPELAGEDVRLALRALEELVGKVGVETILGQIFSQFCIGK